MTTKPNMSSSNTRPKALSGVVTLNGEITTDSRVDKRARYEIPLRKTTDPETFSRFDTYYDTVFVNDFGDRYHELVVDEEADEEFRYLEQRARGIRRRYRNINEYYQAVHDYNKYISALEEKHGQDIFVIKGLERCGMVNDYIPPEPKIKNTKFLKSLVECGKILSNPTQTPPEADAEAIQAIGFMHYHKMYPDEQVVGHPYWEQFPLNDVLDYKYPAEDYTPPVDYSGRVGIQSPFEEAKVKDKFGNTLYDPHANQYGSIDKKVLKGLNEHIDEKIIERKTKYSSPMIDVSKLYDAKKEIETSLFDIANGSIDISDKKTMKKFKKKMDKDIIKMHRKRLSSPHREINMEYVLSDEFWNDPDIYKTKEEIAMGDVETTDSFRFVAGHFIDDYTSDNIDMINFMSNWGWDAYHVMRMRGINKEVARELTGRETKKQRKANEHARNIWSKYMNVDYGEEWTNDRIAENLARFDEFDGDPSEFVII